MRSALLQKDLHLWLAIYLLFRCSVSGTIPLMHPTPMVAGLLTWHDALLGVLSIVTLIFVALFIYELWQGRAPMIESHWGGIGGGGGGWRMSNSLAYLLAMFGIAALLVVVHVREFRPVSEIRDQMSAAATAAPATSASVASPPASTATPH